MLKLCCSTCLIEVVIGLHAQPFMINDKVVCTDCWYMSQTMLRKLEEAGGVGAPKKPEYNEPDHYHEHSVDTIAFLQEGFPPSVFVGFALGSAIKYLQRFEYKNGYEDIDKAMDYILRLKEFLKAKDLL